MCPVRYEVQGSQVRRGAEVGQGHVAVQEPTVPRRSASEHQWTTHRRRCKVRLAAERGFTGIPVIDDKRCSRPGRRWLSLAASVRVGYT